MHPAINLTRASPKRNSAPDGHDQPVVTSSLLMLEVLCLKTQWERGGQRCVPPFRCAQQASHCRTDTDQLRHLLL